MAGAIERPRCCVERSLLKNTLLPAKSSIKSSASLVLKKNSNKQSNLFLYYNSASIKVISKFIKSIAQPNKISKLITQIAGNITKSAAQLRESTGPIDTITPSIKPVPLNLKLPISRFPLLIRSHSFINKFLLGIKVD